MQKKSLDTKLSGSILLTFGFYSPSFFEDIKVYNRGIVVLSFNSLFFILFFSLSLALYYMLPSKYNILVLIGASVIFISFYDIKSIIFLLITSLVIWRTAIFFDKQDKFEGSAVNIKKIKKRALVIAICILLSLLVTLKYLRSFFISFISSDSIMYFVMPLGISYYTLQAISYLMDVYWRRITCEKNFLKLVLYIGYFPQLVQGPVSRYSNFSNEFYLKDHSFNIKNIKFGVQLMLWGFFKVFVIREHAGRFVNRALLFDGEIFGISVIIELVLFGIELYCDFSGGIDIVRGISQCFDINLPDNFNQPFFARSLGDFWRRWHITLGTWMKDYVFFPLTMSRVVTKFKKQAKKHLSRQWVNRIAIAFANICVFLLVGLWHGLGSNYLVWGLYNGLILAFSELMVDIYKTTKTKLHINDHSFWWSIFSIIRTFIIVTIGWSTDCSDTAVDSLSIIRNIFYFNKSNLDIFLFRKIDVLAALFVFIILFTVEIMHEKKISVREKVDKMPVWAQMLFWIILIQLIAVLGRLGVSGGFMYANF